MALAISMTNFASQLVYETVVDFQRKLSNARQIVLVGNGGIATELCYEIDNCKIVWAVKDNHIR